MSKQPSKKEVSLKATLIETAKIIVIAVLLAAILKTFIVDSRVIPSLSMYPTIDTSDRVIVNKLAYLGESNLPERGDIVVFKAPVEMNMKDDLIKRVIGLPGEVLEVSGGTVYINGEALSEPYLAEPVTYQWGPIEIPAGSYVMLGDNRNYSNDAHYWSNPYITEDDIVGRSVYRYWPLDRLGKIDG